MKGGIESWRWLGLLAISLWPQLGCSRSGAGPSGGGKEVPCPDGSAQPGVSIVTVNCGGLLQFDASDIEASVDVEALASAGVKNTEKVLREVSEAAEESQIQFAQSCEMYNSCALSSAEFRDRTDRAQQHFRSIREKVDLIKSAQGSEAAVRQAFTELYSVTLSPEQASRESLLLELSVLGAPSGSAPTILSSGATLRTGDQVVFGVRVSEESWVYLFQRKNSGAIEVLFPSSAMPALTNPLGAAQVLRIPPNGQVFELDNEDLGQEVVYVVASRKPLSGLQEALSKSSSANKSEGAVSDAMVQLFDEGTPECEDKTRGLEIGDADPCARMTRGFQVRQDAAARFFSKEASVKSRSVPGDDVILQVFQFNHAP
jgi:hypothetical protein